MKIKWNLTFGLLLTALAGCTSQDMPDTPTSDNNAEVVKSEKVLAIERYIDRNHKSVTRGEEIQLLPYMVDGDTVMYVANYPGGGFEIFSNDLTLPMVLVKSNTGEYNPKSQLLKSPFDTFLEGTAINIASMNGNSVSLTPDTTWMIYSRLSTMETIGNKKHIGVGVEVSSKEYTPKGGRLNTRWTQYNPYNQFTPYFTDGSGKHALVGCGAIAVGQYLFHSHKYFGIPLSTVNAANYNTTTNTYSFSGSSSTIWDTMVMDSRDEDATKSTAIFLGWVGKELNTSYGTNQNEGSSTYEEDYPSFLKKQCNHQFDYQNFSTVNLKNVLIEGHPALSISWLYKFDYDGSRTTVGHAYLIDYYSHTSATYYDVYADSKRDYEDEEDEEDIDGYGTPLNYFRERYEDITLNYIGMVSEDWVSMNWGWQDNNDLLINAQLPTWPIVHNDFNYEVYYTRILY